MENKNRARKKINIVIPKLHRTKKVLTRLPGCLLGQYRRRDHDCGYDHSRGRGRSHGHSDYLTSPLMLPTPYSHSRSYRDLSAHWQI